MKNVLEDINRVQRIPLSRITRDWEICPREQLDEGVVGKYTRALIRGEKLPPVLLIQTGPKTYLLGEGFHRFQAAIRAGLTEIEAKVRPGTRRECIILAAGANVRHGLPRTDGDVRKASMLMLKDPEFAKLSDRGIAMIVGVDHKVVTDCRREIEATIEKFPVKQPWATHGVAVDAADPVTEANTDKLPLPLSQAAFDVALTMVLLEEQLQAFKDEPLDRVWECIEATRENFTAKRQSLRTVPQGNQPPATTAAVAARLESLLRGIAIVTTDGRTIKLGEGRR